MNPASAAAFKAVFLAHAPSAAEISALRDGFAAATIAIGGLSDEMRALEGQLGVALTACRQMRREAVEFYRELGGTETLLADDEEVTPAFPGMEPLRARLARLAATVQSDEFLRPIHEALCANRELSRPYVRAARAVQHHVSMATARLNLISQEISPPSLFRSEQTTVLRPDHATVVVGGFGIALAQPDQATVMLVREGAASDDQATVLVSAALDEQRTMVISG
ncbi:MAG: hypothetical protein HOQ05_01615 [Corynebacteriales bacterium]|nr:hypothetical protein [Mycobacteriales bacterium]